MSTKLVVETVPALTKGRSRVLSGESDSGHDSSSDSESDIGRTVIRPIPDEQAPPVTKHTTLAKLGMGKLGLGKLGMAKLGLHSVTESNKPTKPSGALSLPSKGGGLGLSLSNLESVREQYGGTHDEASAMKRVERDDPVCSVITRHICLGSNTVASNRDQLVREGVTHILNAALTACPNYHKHTGDFTYLGFPLADGNQENIMSCLYDGIEFIESAVRSGGNVFVHCWQGVSRSTTMIVGWMMLHKGLKFDEALAKVKAIRSIARPNTGFMCQLMEWHKRLTAGPATPVLYKVDIKTHELIVPEEKDGPPLIAASLLEKPLRSSLTTATAAVLHLPSGKTWVWIGKKCPSQFRERAFVHAARLAAHEHANDAVEVVEGQEPDDMLNALV